MGNEEFIYSLEKILSEDVPLSYKIVKGDDYMIISVSESSDMGGLSLGISGDYISVWTAPDDYYDVVWKSHGNVLKNFGRFNDPHKAADKIEEYVNLRFGDVLDRLDDLDFKYCMELKDFLEFNNIDVNTHGYDEGPSLYIDDHPLTITVEFSEYNGRVLVTVNEDYEETRTQMYSSELYENNKKLVFTDILKLVKDAKPWYDGYNAEEE